MRLLVDVCTGATVSAWLRGLGHVVYSVADEAPDMEDVAILQKAFAEDWIVVTNDKGFGENVFRDRMPHKGVVLLRLSDERSPNKIAVLQGLLDRYGDRLAGEFVVVTEESVRIVGGR